MYFRRCTQLSQNKNDSYFCVCFFFPDLRTMIVIFEFFIRIISIWGHFLSTTYRNSWRQNYSMYIFLVKLLHVLTNASMGMYKIRVLTDIFEYYHQFHARKIMPRNNELKDREYFGNKWWSRTKNNKMLLLVENLICV